jgi:hypothetical protein
MIVLKEYRKINGNSHGKKESNDKNEKNEKNEDNTHGNNNNNNNVLKLKISTNISS